MKKTDVLTMGEVTARSGFAASAVRFYEDEGLLHAVRAGSGHRRFERSTLRRLAFIKAASTIGLSLQEIREELATLPDNRTPTKADWERISRHWRGRIEDRINALERLRDDLTGCIGCGCLSLQRCSIYNPGDVLATSDAAPGAARLPRALR